MGTGDIIPFGYSSMQSTVMSSKCALPDKVRVSPRRVSPVGAGVMARDPQGDDVGKHG
jgi:hypothetical protein